MVAAVTSQMFRRWVKSCSSGVAFFFFFLFNLISGMVTGSLSDAEEWKWVAVMPSTYLSSAGNLFRVLPKINFPMGEFLWYRSWAYTTASKVVGRPKKYLFPFNFMSRLLYAFVTSSKTC